MIGVKGVAYLSLHRLFIIINRNCAEYRVCNSSRHSTFDLSTLLQQTVITTIPFLIEFARRFCFTWHFHLSQFKSNRVRNSNRLSAGMIILNSTKQRNLFTLSAAGFAS
jgi:hypothetical protein